MSEELAPGLYLVATPIGNLGDITLRALEVLKQADRIACEDTRQTQKLLNHFAIATPTTSYHQHNERQRGTELIESLKSGARIAVVSDAGMPGISDPGSWLVEAAIAAGVPVFPIPGANAALSALIASGLSTGQFQFLGFLPEKAGARRTRLEELAASPTPSLISNPSSAPLSASWPRANLPSSTRNSCEAPSPKCGNNSPAATVSAASSYSLLKLLPRLWVHRVWILRTGKASPPALPVFNPKAASTKRRPSSVWLVN
jgi:hypothetical protein